MTRLKQHNHLAELQILYNESSADYKATMRNIWKVNNQLLPPNIHRCNAAERAIITFKAHFLSVLAGIAEDLQKNMWYLLITQP